MGKLRRLIQKTRNLLNFDVNKTVEDLNKTVDGIELLRKEVQTLSDRVNHLDCNYGLINQKVDFLKNRLNYFSIENIALASRFSNTKKILICGFYGAFNLGDELMLNKMLENIEKLGDFDITIMLCDNPYTDVTRYGRYHFIHYPKTSADLNYIASYYDCLIFGGGALIDDFHYDEIDSQMTLGYILVNLTMRFIAFEKKTILYGLSTNSSFENQEFIKKLDYVVNNCTYFSLRDTNSLKILERLKINVSKVKIVDDIVFAYDFSNYNTISRNSINVGIIYVITNENKDDIIENSKRILSYLDHHDKKYHINFIPFYDYLGSDVKFYKELKKILNREDIDIPDYEFEFTKVISMINNCDYIISMRYHGSLIANMLNKKTLSIVYKNHRHYKNKMNYLYDNYGFDKNMQYEINDEGLNKLFEINHKTISNSKLNKIREKADSDINDALKNIQD